MEPFECVLINWPPGVESAVHLHKGLFGYVWVLEGELDNFSYRLENNELVEFSINKYFENGLIPEPDGVIHKLKNNSNTARAITLHFYYPAIKSFEGMQIFNLETGQMGRLSDQAKTATWLTTPGHFKEIQDNAFKYISYPELNNDKSHVICNVFPKPTDDQINAMNAAYFGEQAAQYDFSDFNQPKRKAYIETINHLVASGIKSQQEVYNHLDIATGTGRRALRIKELSNKTYDIVGIDICKEMSELAALRGLKTYHQNWTKDDTLIAESFDVITFLYAFGHIASEKARIKTLSKVASHLKHDGVFYFDIFSLLNKNEWGAQAEKVFEEKKLDQFGYQKGDIFYRKLKHQKIAFLHYFTIKEVGRLLQQCGLKIVDSHFVGYAKNPGEIVSSETEGNIFIAAKKI